MLAITILDSVTHLTDAHHGSVAYCASHGGTYAGYYAATKGIAAVVLNDAGIGRERAGLAGLELLQTLGVPAAAIAHTSARIGDGADGMWRGVLSFTNPAAAALGVAPGMTCADALHHLASAQLTPAPAPPTQREARFEIGDAARGAVRVFGLDSVSLVTPDDVGHVVVTASHGGILGDKPETAVKYEVRAAVFNDAGGGTDGAGFSRLAALDARSIAAATVSCFSARIGDARSTWHDGYISAVNQTAAKRGALIGQSTRDFVAAIIDG
jgi:hypothetical protein